MSTNSLAGGTPVSAIVRTTHAVIAFFTQRRAAVPPTARPLYDLVAVAQRAVGGTPVPLSMDQLSDALGVTRATVSRMSKSLQTRGILHVIYASEHDRRHGVSARYRLLDEGRYGLPQTTALPAAEIVTSVAEVKPAADFSLKGERASIQGRRPEASMTQAESMRACALILGSDAIATAVRDAESSGNFEQIERGDCTDSDKRLLIAHVACLREVQQKIPPAKAAESTHTSSCGGNLKRSNGPVPIGAVLVSGAAQQAAAAEKTPHAVEVASPSSYGDMKLRSAWTRMCEALGGTERAKAMWAELRWSVTKGQLAKLGQRAVDVGVKLILEGRWSPPAYIPDAAYRVVRDDDFAWLHS